MTSSIIIPWKLFLFFLLLAIFLCPYLFTLRYGNAKSKYNKWYKQSILFLVLGFAVLIFFFAFIWNTKINRITPTSYTRADGFTIENYKIVMDVSKSNSIDVKEYITTNFYGSGHHGIYRFLPSWLEYTSKDNVTKSREAKLKNLKAVGENYTIDTVNGKKRIKIGDKNTTLPIGEHNYEIDYTYDMGGDPYKQFDEFIFHAFGDYWGTEIKNASVIIHFPKSLDQENKIKFFADKYRKKDITSYVNYSVKENTISAYLLPNYALNSALTIDVELKEGYFVNGSNPYGIFSLILCLFCIVFAFFSFHLWRKYGKDLTKIPETVTFYPPENLDAADIGYLYKKDAGKKLSIALIIELASKGFIKIVEKEDKTRTIVKLPLSKEQKKMPKMTANEEIIYNKLFETSNETDLSSNYSFYEVFQEIGKNVGNTYDDKINDFIAYRAMAITSFSFFLGTLFFGFAYCIFKDLNPKFSILYMIALIANIITFIFTVLMKRKTSYGEQIEAKIKGFKNYIEIAEKKQIEMLVEENPNYFYDILPYAYVLGVSKKWIEKFENIPTIREDIGNFDYFDIASLDSLSDSIYTPSSSSGGGCSSCGGGCSSCGGGGSW